MNNAYRSGYRKKKIPDLLRAIDDCTSLSQLFALIQHEQIEIWMHAQSGASNLTPRKLSAKEIIEQNDLPLDRLKAEVKRSVCGSYVPSNLTDADSELIQAIIDTKTLRRAHCDPHACPVGRVQPHAQKAGAEGAGGHR